MKRLWIAGLLFLMVAATFAQGDGGQFWVQMYEDRNGNAVRDAGEPLLSHGVAVNLIDSSGVVVATALLDESPSAAQGLIGFQFLSPGEYTVAISSPEYAATTETTFTRMIEIGATPTVVEFGAQRADAVTTAENRTPRGLFGLPIYLGEPAQVARVALSLLGAVIVSGLMTVFGLLVYSLTIRRRQREDWRALRAEYPRR